MLDSTPFVSLRSPTDTDTDTVTDTDTDTVAPPVPAAKRRKPKKKAKSTLVEDPILTPPVPAPETVPAGPEADAEADEAERLPRLDRIAKMAADRFGKRQRNRRKPEDDPNQGNLF